MSKHIIFLFTALLILARLPADAATFNGPWIQGAMVTGQTELGESIIYDGKALRISKDGYFAFGLGRNAPEQVSVVVQSASGQSTTLSFNVQPRDYRVQRINGVKKKHVTPPDAVTSRIKREAAAVRLARQLDDNRTGFLESFIWPVKGTITGVYGSQRFYNGEARSPHYGIDIAAPKGTPVIAPASGVVTFAEDDLYYSGGTLIVDHGHGISSTFIHLSGIDVAVGDVVAQGDTIARVGSTGRSTGPHLDWRMNWFNQRIDPQLVVPKGSTPEQ